MDLIKIGKFLAALRHEKNLTQEQLGEKLGVTNKTVSRWENGNYMPPVEMLKLISELYEVSINEILSGQRLSAEEYREKAEENIQTALSGTFSLNERMSFFKDKWKKEHRGSLIIWGIVLGAFGFGCIALKVFAGVDLALYGVIAAALGAAAVNIVRYNKMMSYVEEKSFDGSGRR